MSRLCPGCAVGFHCDGDDPDPAFCSCQCVRDGQEVRMVALATIAEAIDDSDNP